MSKNRCVAEKGEDLPLNISRSSSCSWFYLKTASLVNLLQGAGEGGRLRARQCQSGMGSRALRGIKANLKYCLPCL